MLRASGRPAEALDLEIDELRKAMAEARLASGGDEETEAAVLAQEHERVANATVIAELMAPMLAERLRAQMPSAAVSTSAAVSRNPPPTSSPAAAPVQNKMPPANAPSIADLLDGMLAQSPSLARPGARP